MKKLLVVASLFLLLIPGLFGQTSSLSGTVTDPTGAVIPNASITVVNAQTGSQRQAMSDLQGRYNMEQLPPGTYTLTAKSSGFVDTVIQGVQLLVNQPANMAVVFEKLGATTTAVTVEASANQVNTQDASLGNVIGSQAIVELPFFARACAKDFWARMSTAPMK